MFIVKLYNELFFQLHLILHAYVSRFDVKGTVEKNLATKHGLSDRRVAGEVTQAAGNMVNGSTLLPGMLCPEPLSEVTAHYSGLAE